MAYEFKIGKANLVKEGTDLTIAACGVMVAIALEAAQRLEKEYAKKIEVINVASIKPLDAETICKSVSKTKKIIVAEEHNIIGGLGESIAAALLENSCTDIKFKRLGVDDRFGQSAKAEELLVHYGLSADNLVNLALGMFS